MKVETSEIEYCKVKITYEADLDQIESKRSEVLMQFKNAPVPGNRKGRASLDAVRIYYYSQIEKALEQAMAEQAFHDGTFEAGIKSFGAPEFSHIELKKNKFSCSFIVNHKPKFELSQYKDLEVPKPHTTVNLTEEVEKILENMRTRFGDSIPYTEEEFVQENDIVIIDYEAFDGEVKLENASGSGQIVTIGKSGLPGLDENLLGMKLNETRHFELQMPETALPSLADKKLTFYVTLIMGSKVIPMPLNDDLAQKAGQPNLIELRNFVTGVAQAQQQELERSNNSQQIMSHLLSKNDIKVPTWLTLSEAQYVAAAGGTKWEALIDADKEEYLTTAEKNVKMALILDEIRNREPEAQLSDQEVLRAIEQNLAKNQNQEQIDQTMMELNKSGKLPILAARMKDEFTMDFLIKNTKFVE